MQAVHAGPRSSLVGNLWVRQHESHYLCLYPARLRGRSDARYSAALWERFGFGYALPPSGVAPVWVHALSLGETRAAQPLVQELLKRRWPVILTHTTATGRRGAAQLFSVAIDSGQLRQAWLPYDTPGACRRFLDEVAPSCGILIEREVWPNMIHEANARGVPMVLASARLSERSAKRGRYAGRVLRDGYAGLDRVLAQTEQDAARLRACGARDVKVCGNIKFDMAVPADQAALGRAWREMWHRRVVVVASTHEGEEAAFIQAYASHEWPDEGGDAPLLIIVPRHPERFESVAAHLAKTRLRWVRRTAIDLLQPLPEGTQIILGDSMGELAAYYAASDVAIVAGTFVAAEGQHLIEPCAVSTPVVVGPHSRNFMQVTQEAVSVGAALRAPDPAGALDIAIKLVDNAPARADMIAAGLRYVTSHTGAVERIVRDVSHYCPNAGSSQARLVPCPTTFRRCSFCSRPPTGPARTHSSCRNRHPCRVTNALPYSFLGGTSWPSLRPVRPRTPCCKVPTCHGISIRSPPRPTAADVVEIDDKSAARIVSEQLKQCTDYVNDQKPGKSIAMPTA